MRFPLNFEWLHEIDITPDTTATYSRLASGLSNFGQDPNEQSDQTPYLDGEGFGESDVIGAQLVVSYSGHRQIDDAAQNYIMSKQLSLGSARRSNFRITDPFGNVKSGACTIMSIVGGGGDAAAKSAISFEIHLNGKPTQAPATTAPALTATVAAGSVAATTKFTATPGASNTLAYKLSGAAITAPKAGEYPLDVLAYTSADNIPAAVGQYLDMYELDANGRVVLFLEQVLASGDIGA